MRIFVGGRNFEAFITGDGPDRTAIVMLGNVMVSSCLLSDTKGDGSDAVDEALSRLGAKLAAPLTVVIEPVGAAEDLSTRSLERFADSPSLPRRVAEHAEVLAARERVWVATRERMAAARERKRDGICCGDCPRCHDTKAGA